MSEFPIEQIPLGVIKQHLLPYLHGFNLLNFSATCRRYRGLLSFKERLRQAFNSSNVVVAVEKSNKYKLCSCGVWCKIHTHVRWCHQVPASMICYCYGDKHQHKCPLYMVTCMNCKATGPVVDLAPWNIVLIGASPFNRVDRFRYNISQSVKNIWYCIHCVEGNTCQELHPASMALKRLARFDHEITYEDTFTKDKLKPQFKCTITWFNKEKYERCSTGHTKQEALLNACEGRYTLYPSWVMK